MVTGPESPRGRRPVGASPTEFFGSDLSVVQFTLCGIPPRSTWGTAVVSTSGIITLLIGALILHLIEEVNMGFRERFPTGGMSLPLFVVINVAVYAFCFATLILSARDGELAMPFAWIFAVTMFVNGLGHVGIMVVRHRYFPGGLTAILLLLLSGYLLLHLSVTNS